MSSPSIITAEQHDAALRWLSLLHDQPSAADQARFSQWLQADPAHAEAYAQAQVLWELSEEPAAKLAGEDAATLDALLKAMDAPPALSQRSWSRWGGGLALAACLLLAVSIGLGFQPQRWIDDVGADYVSAPGQVRSVTLAVR